MGIAALRHDGAVPIRTPRNKAGEAGPPSKDDFDASTHVLLQREQLADRWQHNLQAPKPRQQQPRWTAEDDDALGRAFRGTDRARKEQDASVRRETHTLRK